MDKEQLDELLRVSNNELKAAAEKHKQVVDIIRLAKEGIDNFDRPHNVQYTGLPKPTHFTVGEDENWVIWENNKAMFNGKLTAHAIKFEGGAIFDMVNGWRDQRAQSIESVPKTETIKCQSCGEIFNDFYSFQFHDCNSNIDRCVPRYPDETNFGIHDVLRGQDKPSIPDCAYLNRHDGKFHSRLDGTFMGTGFQEKWENRKHEFTDNPHWPDPLKDKTVHAISTDQRIVPRELLEETINLLRNMAVNKEKVSIRDIDTQIGKLCKSILTEKPELQASAGQKRETYEPHKVCNNYNPAWNGLNCLTCGASKEIHLDKINKEKP